MTQDDVVTRILFAFLAVELLKFDKNPKIHPVCTQLKLTSALILEFCTRQAGKRRMEDRLLGAFVKPNKQRGNVPRAWEQLTAAAKKNGVWDVAER